MAPLMSGVPSYVLVELPAVIVTGWVLGVTESVPK